MAPKPSSSPTNLFHTIILLPLLLATFLGISHPYLQNRLRILRLFTQNNPAVLPEISAWPHSSSSSSSSFSSSSSSNDTTTNNHLLLQPTILFSDRIRSCEDVIIVPTTTTTTATKGRKGIALMACDAGRERWNDVMGIFHPGPDNDEEKLIKGAELFVMRYGGGGGGGGGGGDKEEEGEEEEEQTTLTKIPIINYPTKDGSADYDLKTLGLAFDADANLLYVCNHRRAGASRIDVFRLEGGGFEGNEEGQEEEEEEEQEEEEEELKAVWTKSLEHPLIRGPNSIAIAPASSFPSSSSSSSSSKKCHQIYITNDHHFLIAESRLLAQLETYLALPLGTVVRVKFCEDDDDDDDDNTSDDEIQAQVMARLPFANGIEFLPSSSSQNNNKNNNKQQKQQQQQVAVSSTSRAAVHIYDISYDSPHQQQQQQEEEEKWSFAYEIPVPFFPDNLAISVAADESFSSTTTGSSSSSSSSSSSLLIAGHPHIPSMGRYAGTRWICNDEAELAAAVQDDEAMREWCLEEAEEDDDDEQDGSKPKKTGSWVMEWELLGGLGDDEKKKKKEPKTLYSGTGYPTSATAAWDRERNVGIVAGLYAKGLMVWK